MFPINNNHNYDVVIIGAGPIGITTASLLKTLNKDLKICVLDKRSEPTRKHGLNIRADSMNRLLGVIKEAFNNVLVDKNQADGKWYRHRRIRSAQWRQLLVEGLSGLSGGKL